MTDSAADLRQRGNFEFSTGKYDNALAFYTAALEHVHDDSDDRNREERILNLCNRSACYSQQEEWDLSKEDAYKAWKLSGEKSVKAAYRLSKTCLHLKQYDTAKQTIQAALKVLDEIDLTSIPAKDVGKPDVPDRRQIEEAEERMDTSSPQQSLTGVNDAKNEPQTHPLDTSRQRRSLQDLWNQVLKAAFTDDQKNDNGLETSIKYVKRPISIKEFQSSNELGHGNFSEIVTVTHKVTGERFALKMIAKKQAADLAKRQHPNVYNEIQMERRVLLERLSSPGHPFIIRMYHAFQDYNTLFYLMDLHTARGDLWSRLRYKSLPGLGHTTEVDPTESVVMMGCHRSTACLWLYELISALEYMHDRGIVHRDLKTENLLIDAQGHIIVIDFGTAKDLIRTDLNGPEFVGTPDFMSPEAVTGKDPTAKSSIGSVKEEGHGSFAEAGTSADLWALGAVCFQLQTGYTPYWCQSPYLAFMKIKRALESQNIRRPEGIIDDECWDFITSLMKGKPEDRLGADAFVVVQGNGSKRRIERQRADGYDILRRHPYFSQVHSELQSHEVVRSKALPIPTLSDLCIRAVAEMAFRDSLDLELCDRHPPGDGSRHDLLRLKPRECAAVRHCLDRRRILAEPRLYARFYSDTVSARLDKVRTRTHTFVGLEQMNDDQGKPPKAKMHDQYAKPIEMDPIRIVHLTNPLFAVEDTVSSMDEATRKSWIKLLKRCVATINRSRPNMVVVAGNLNQSSRKIVARISETIPVVVHDGSTFFTFWMSGVQCIALKHTMRDDDDAMYWLREQLEQVRMSKHPLYVFVDGDPRRLSQLVLKKLARGRTLALYGILTLASAAESVDDAVWESKICYTANELVQQDIENDAISINSTESDEDGELSNFSMNVSATCANGLRWITVEEEPDSWKSDFQRIDLASSSTNV